MIRIWSSACMKGANAGTLSLSSRGRLAGASTTRYLVCNARRDCALRGERAWLVDGQNRATILAPGTHHLPKMPGRKLSLLAYSPEVRDVTLTGAKWTLTRATLTYRYPLGCSNEFTADMAEVTFREGLLMVCFSADKNP